jgi:predicted HTH transcriptional regulator
MTDTTNLEFYIQHRKEERYLEYKRSMVWTNDNTKVEVAKAMMAMSNLRNGGVVVIGMREINRGIWEPEDMTHEQIISFTQDDIAQWVNDYAVPAVQFTVEPLLLDDKNFVIIQVREFDSYPAICRKQKTLRGVEVLRAGAIYYRSNRKNESAPISSEEDIRELIRLAVDKGVAQEIERLRVLGFVATLPAPQKDATLKYGQEREGL